MRLFLICAVFIFLPLVGNAASLRLELGEVPVRVGQPVTVSVFVDESAVKVNALESSLAYDSDALKFTGSSDTDSVINFWIKYPYVCGSEICFSGIAPGGFVGNNQAITSLEFVPNKSGTTTIELKDYQLLAHDGKGTDVPISHSRLEFFIEPSSAEFTPTNDLDAEPPEPFTAFVAKDEAVEDGLYVVIFDTKDKQTSVAGYYVKEYRIPLFSWLALWREAESPFVLKDQTLSSVIEVKAVDQSGNERVSVVLPQSNSFAYKFYLLCVILLILPIVIYRFYFSRKDASSK
jgi:hypothetical protein